MKCIYLYVKTHNVTGLKYFGKTTRDPSKYKGSGKYWLSHLKKYGYDVSTEIVFISNNKEEIKEKATELSIKWGIVASVDWANLKLEIGDGGYPGYASDALRQAARRQGLRNVENGHLDRIKDIEASRQAGLIQGARNVINGHLKRISDGRGGRAAAKKMTPEELSARGRAGGSKSWAYRDKELYINSDWFKKFNESGKRALAAIPKEIRIENARHARDHLSKERIKEIAASGGRIGGKISGRNSVINGSFDKVRLAAYASKRGKKWFTDPVTGETAFFKKDCQPNGWVVGRLNHNPVNTWTKGRVWVTDGKTQTTVPNNKIPEGFVEGRLGKDGKMNSYVRLAVRLVKRKMRIDHALRIEK